MIIDSEDEEEEGVVSKGSTSAPEGGVVSKGSISAPKDEGNVDDKGVVGRNGENGVVKNRTTPMGSLSATPTVSRTASRTTPPTTPTSPPVARKGVSAKIPPRRPTGEYTKPEEVGKG